MSAIWESVTVGSRITPSLFSFMSLLRSFSKNGLACKGTFLWTWNCFPSFATKLMSHGPKQANSWSRFSRFMLGFLNWCCLLELGARRDTSTGLKKLFSENLRISNDFLLEMDMSCTAPQMIPNRKWSPDRIWSPNWTAKEPEPQMIQDVDRKWCRWKMNNGMEFVPRVVVSIFNINRSKS